MKSNIFRKVSLDRLASPEQLDHLLHITGPKKWVSLAGLVILLGALIVWGYKGSISTTAAGTGVIVRSGGVLNVVTQGSGVVVSLNVKVGDKIKANQVVAKVAQPILAEKLRAQQSALEEAKRERELALRTQKESVRLRIDAMERELANHQHEITQLQDQVKLSQEEVKVQDELLGKGLVTKQQTISAREALMHLENQIADLQAQNKQLESQKFSTATETEKEDEDRRVRISSMERDLAGSMKELEMAEEVISPYAGEVLELKVYSGSTVSAAEPIFSIQPDVHDLELLAYLPSYQAKAAAVNMDVQVSPSNVKREEYGFMKGKIVHVAAYPATPSALMRNFQNESLVNTIQGPGPVTELRVLLEQDGQTPTGFKWSTSEGPPVAISSGTICTVQVVVQRQKPIMLLFPYLKSRLGLS